MMMLHHQMKIHQRWITDVILIFTNAANPNDVVMAAAQDPDGEGLDDLEVLGDINLSTDTEYILTYTIENRLDPTDIEDIGEEILDEDNEHQFFFSFTTDVFANPTGNGKHRYGFRSNKL